MFIFNIFYIINKDRKKEYKNKNKIKISEYNNSLKGGKAMKKKFKVNLKKEVYTKKTEEGGYLHPIRQYMIEYYDEVYQLDIDDQIIGNNGGKYDAKLFFLSSNIDREKKKIYQYDYNKNQANEFCNENYNDIIQYLLDNGIIRRIKPSKNLL